ncbi:MAG: PqqD family protein [Proteobacteria bacterium]|nr:PqqD family protein [Pseudomonadota bacterium]
MTIVRRQGEWLSAKIGDELVMMSATNRHYVGMSEVGARIWELIEQPRSLDDVCTLLLDEYDVAPQVCRGEVEAFLRELMNHGAVALDPPPAA